MSLKDFLRTQLKPVQTPARRIRTGFLDIPIVTDVVTPPRPPVPTITPITGAGITTRYMSPEAYKAIGLEPERFLKEVERKEPSLYQKIQQYPIAAATTPLFNIGGVGISASDITALGLIGYGAYQGAKVLPQLFKKVGDKTLKIALNTGLDKWIAQRSRGVPAARFKILQDVLYNQIVKNKTWLQQKATENMLNRMGRGVNATRVATEAVDEALQTFENTLLPTITVTNTAVPGQQFTLSQIISGLTGKVPKTVQAAQAGRMELGKVPEKPVPAKVTPEVAKGKQIVKYEKGSVGDAVRAAKELKATENLFVYPTAEGMAIGRQTPPFGIQHIVVKPDGTHQVVSASASFEAGRQAGVEPVAPATLPTPEPGMPEAGLQPSMVEGVASIEVRPVGKGRVTQISMDEQLKLGQMRREAETPEKFGIAKERIRELETEVGREPIEAATIAPTPAVTAPIAEAKAEIPTQPPSPAKPPVAEIAPEEYPEFPTRPEMSDLQDADFVVGLVTKPDFSRTLANLPGIKQIMSTLNPSAIANTPAEKFLVGRAYLRDQGINKTPSIMSHLLRMGNQEKMFGKMDDTGLLASGKLKGQSVNDLAQNPQKYDLTTAQREWLDRAHDIEQAKLDFLRRNGIEINELSFPEGGRYAGRKVYAKLSTDGEILDTGYVGAGPSRVGKKLGAERHRTFATVKEAVAAGYRYLPYDEALSLNVRGAYNRVADQKMADWFLAKVPWRTTGAPAELVMAAESAKFRADRSKMLSAALNRAVRGERVPENTIASIARVYPNEAQQLRDLIPRIQKGEKTAEEVQALTKKAKLLTKVDNKDKWDAVNARARAREKAMAPRYGEAMVMQPAFGGKILTGEQAKETARVLREGLEPHYGQLEKAIQAMNKVNALVRYFKLAGDVSPLAIQLLYVSGEPQIYAQFPVAFARVMFDKEFHARFIADNREMIEKHPGVIWSMSGNEFTEAMQRGGLLSRDINLWSKQDSLLKKIGILPARVIGKTGATVLEPFQRGFEGILDYAAIKLLKAKEHIATTPEQIAELDQWVNEFRGLTSSAKLGVSRIQAEAETATLLAPRYNRAIAALLFDAFKGTISIGHSGVRAKLARDGLAKGIAAVSAMALLISLVRGEDWDDIKEHFNPTSSRFMTWNIAGANIGPGTKLRSVIKLLAESWDNPESLLQKGMENPALRFVRGNLAPVFGNAIDLLTGRNYIGDPVRDNINNFTREMLVSQFLPIWVENVLMEGGNVSQRAIRGTSEFFGGRAYPETTTEMVNRLYERYAAQDLGKELDELNNLERKELERKHTDLAEAKEDNQKYWSERSDNIGIALDIEQQKIESEMNKSLEDAALKLLAGEISKYDYDKNRSYVRPYASGGKSVLWSLRETLKPYEMKQYEKWYEDNTKPEDKAYNDYQEYRATMIEKADLPTDWDIIDSELKIYLNRYSPEIKQYIIGRQDDWIKDLSMAAQQIELKRLKGIEDESWWDNYRGEPTSEFEWPETSRGKSMIETPKTSGLSETPTQRGKKSMIEVPALR